MLQCMTSPCIAKLCDRLDDRAIIFGTVHVEKEEINDDDMKQAAGNSDRAANIIQLAILLYGHSMESWRYEQRVKWLLNIRVGSVLATVLLFSLVPAPFTAVTVNEYASQVVISGLKMNMLVPCTVTECGPPTIAPLVASSCWITIT